MSWMMWSFQDSNSFIMENLFIFHMRVMLVIEMILVFIIYLLIILIKMMYNNRFTFNGQMIEIIWTIIPMILLFYLIIPSLKILYLTDELLNSLLMIKVLGHQWYWSYEYMDFNLNFDSFMLESKNKYFRLLDVDNRLILPMNFNLQICVSSLDVIHSFAVPSLGIKVDGIPGRLNLISLLIIRPGLMFGQCSEICGVNHSFMPIVLEVVDMKTFMNWLSWVMLWNKEDEI